MGGTCSGDGRRRRHSTRMVNSSTTEPLLRENEREAVSNLLRYLEQGGSSFVLILVAPHIPYTHTYGQTPAVFFATV